MHLVQELNVVTVLHRRQITVTSYSFIYIRKVSTTNKIFRLLPNAGRLHVHGILNCTQTN